MKKLLSILFVILTVSSCQEHTIYYQQVNQHKNEKWIVEEKRANASGYNTLTISDVCDPTNITHINVGNYTFSKISVGDTLNYKHI